jgi:ubiquinone/menaquinone biosynthesis C-methylase UbiE
MKHHPRAHMLGLFTHARAYDRLAGRAFGRLYTRVAADVVAAGLEPGSRVLDVGTGPGRVPIAIATAAPHLRVEGLDLLPEMVEHARRSAAAAGLADRVAFTVGDVAALPYPDASFDLVVSSMSQHHWPDARAGLRELGRVIRPGGHIWIYDLRPALRRADAAARGAFPAEQVRREIVRTSRFPVSLVGRVAV